MQYQQEDNNKTKQTKITIKVCTALTRPDKQSQTWQKKIKPDKIHYIIHKM